MMVAVPAMRGDAMTTMMDMLLPSAGNDIFERILAAPGGLVALRCEDGAGLLEQFRVIARHTGQAVYLWQPNTGLTSLRDAHMRVPEALRLGPALRYMLQSMHFGVYLMQGVELPLSTAEMASLRQLARAPTGHLRRVVLLNAPTALVEQLGDSLQRLVSDDGAPPRLRLRDGRWLS